MNASFRLVTSGEVAATHALYLDVVAWLRAKGIRQWLRPLTAEEFAERQARGELFGAFNETRLVATVSLAFEEDDDWREHIGPEKRWWLKTLAVARAGGGQGVGEWTVRACETHLGDGGAKELYLECVDGFLPTYYECFGYEVLKRATITYPSGNTFAVAAMRKNLA